MGGTVESGFGRRGFRAIALVVAVALLMAFGWSARQAMDGIELGAPGGRSAAVEFTDGIGAGDLGPVLRAVKPPLDQFHLPRPLTVETARIALVVPPLPAAAALAPPVAAREPDWVRLSRVAPDRARARPEALGWGSARTPTGPPAA